MSTNDAQNEHDSNEPAGVLVPPTSLGGILKRLGPGLIVAGSIVGSGELIATTRTGAEAGFLLLWLIIIGCVIKVFAQVEFGRYSIVTGRTTMDGLAEVPGPRIPGRGNWIVWYWFVMWFASIGQLGGIVGGVGQALSISLPITEAGRLYNDYVDTRTGISITRAELSRAEVLKAEGRATDEDIAKFTARIAALEIEVNEKLATAAERLDDDARSDYEDKNDLLRRLKIDKAAATGDAADDLGESIAKVESEIQEIVIGPLNASYIWGIELTEKIKWEVRVTDPLIWAIIIALITSVMLVIGHYGLIQWFSTFMVAFFTLITIMTLFMLQGNATWAVTADEIVSGLSFSLPEAVGNLTPVATALATFGIIGVGASELVTYPYWCIEKGYGKFTGPRDESAGWGERARGWMKVMRYDAWCSMVVYTFATVAFYLLGAATLGRSGLVPEKDEMVRTLAVMYEPVFGTLTQMIFLVGAFAVLYSTFFVANASHARVFSDSLRVLGLGTDGRQAYRARVKFLSGFFPLLCVFMFALFPKPAMLVLISGLMQAIMLPMLAGAALYFRYFRSDERVKPTLMWDIFLYISAVGMLVAGVWALWSKIGPFIMQ